ncbi:DUF2207 domain-containing protein [Desulfurobacterium sp.]|uniref:DUF2207 domain-containing protein n=1 Tax=Desulfurobacterium sp. TaxID=2004706 RepID=UPI00261A557E|nr:DUF2207 domain-containing protein [Desulfurobacterium sp.]
MTEKRIFTAAVIVSLILVFVAFYDFRLLFSSLLADYTAVITLNDTVSLQENFDFRVKKDNKYSMLFRNWKVPLTFKNENFNNPHITVESLNASYPWYVVDYAHRVYLQTPDRALAAICKSKAFNNEIGIVRGVNGGFLKRFNRGIYTLSAFYSLYPPIETDGNLSHLNIKLADSHVFYPEVKIILKDPKSLIKKLYVHMVDYSVKVVHSGYVITGKAPDDSLVELEMVLKNPSPFKGFYRRVSDVTVLTEKMNRDLYAFIVKIADKLVIVAIVVFPFFMVYYYNRFGSEISATVPEYISFVPDKKKKPS